MPPVVPSASALPDYAELHCASNFSFLRGASQPEELVARAAQLGYRALAITDECSLAGVVRAHVEAKKHQLQLLVGSQFQLDDGDDDASTTAGPFTLVALAQNRAGYGNLAELITLARSRAAKGSYALAPRDFEAPPAGSEHLRGLPDCLLILVPRHGSDAAQLERQAAWLARSFDGRAWLGLSLLHQAHDERQRRLLEDAGRRHALPLVAVGDVCMHLRSRKPLQDTLTAIRLGQPVAECGYALAPNAEQHLRSRLRLANLYPAAVLAETLHIARQCNFSLDQLRYEYPDELVPAGDSVSSYLRRETLAGAERRFPAGVPERVRQQVEHELALIGDLAYEPYFLTVYDIVRFARSRDILCQGRGSAANSAVCYCLGITEVDPEHAHMLFERFISKERNEPPDIDVDFEHQRREEVIQYVYRKYGRRRAALTAVVISYRPRSALRDVGRALGVDASIVDQVAKSHRWWDGKNNLAERFAECGLDPDSPLARQWAGLAEQLMRFPRHLSQHPGGFVIARDKLSRLVPIENAAMAERSVVQWDKDDLDALGLLKVDILALGMLSMLRRAFDLIGAQRGVPFAMQDIPRKDAATYDMICQADTVGVFQIESRAQMSMLPRLLPRQFYDLVIQVAIVRPGPIQGDMVHPFLNNRRLRPEQIPYPKDEIRPALERTCGVPIFQEQVMQVAMIAADFSASDADGMRRSMGAWRRQGDLVKYKERLQAGMKRKGYPEKFIADIQRQIEGFSEYGFPESHAAGFALLAYASAWLKRHHPAVFLAALLNSQPMGFYSPSQLVQDARRHRVEVRPVDIDTSGWEARLEQADGEAPAVRLGFALVAGLGAEAAERIVAARAARPFADVADLGQRAQLSRRELQALAAANALRPLSGHRRQALWQALAGAPDRDLLQPAPIREAPLRLAPPSEAEEITGDHHALGLSLGRHPLALLRPALAKRRFLPAATLNGYTSGRVARAAGIVTGRQRPHTANGTIFVTIEDETGPVNVIVWPALVERQRRELLASSLLGVYGIWQCEGIVRHLVAKRLVDLSAWLGRLPTSSRDFA